MNRVRYILLFLPSFFRHQNEWKTKCGFCKTMSWVKNESRKSRIVFHYFFWSLPSCRRIQNKSIQLHFQHFTQEMRDFTDVSTNCLYICVFACVCLSWGAKIIDWKFRNLFTYYFKNIMLILNTHFFTWHSMFQVKWVHIWNTWHFVRFGNVIFSWYQTREEDYKCYTKHSLIKLDEKL